MGASGAVALERPLASSLAPAWLGRGVRLLPPVSSLRKHLLSPSVAGCGGSAAAAPTLAPRAGKGLRPTRDSRKRCGCQTRSLSLGLLVGELYRGFFCFVPYEPGVGPGLRAAVPDQPRRQAVLGRPRACTGARKRPQHISHQLGVFREADASRAFRVQPPAAVVRASSAEELAAPGAWPPLLRGRVPRGAVPGGPSSRSSGGASPCSP